MQRKSTMAGESNGDMKKCTNELEEQQNKLTDSTIAPGSSSDNESTTCEKNCCNKSIQIDMDGDSDDEPGKTKKYWQDLAGLRGAREQYLQLDIRELGAERVRQADRINFLKAKLARALNEIMELKARRCRCDEEEELDLYRSKSFSSIGL